MLSFIYVLLFVLKLKFPSNVPISTYIKNKYGHYTLQKFRKWERLRLKIDKCTCDQDFLNKCKIYNIFPKFLYFKLYDKNIYNSEIYLKFQHKLLSNEIKKKNKLLSRFKRDCSLLSNTLRQDLSFLDFHYLNFFITKITKRTISKVKITHEKKLNNLGINNELKPLDPNKVIFNFSDRILSHKERWLLSFGLNFKLPVFKLNFYSYYHKFESFYQQLLKLPHYRCNGVLSLKSYLQPLINKFYFNFKPYKVFSPIIKKDDIKILRNLSKDNTITITRPDKGHGVVILNKDDYINKVTTILSDTSKFKVVDHIDPFLHTLRLENRVNYIINKLYKAGTISESTKNNLLCHGSQPGVLYGLPKIHKPNIPVRPILSANGTATYNVSKFIIEQISHLTCNDFSVKNSYQFTDFIKTIPNANNLTMVSFDITSLFTNIPVDETNNIIINKLFPQNDTVFNNFTKSEFKSLLNTATKNNSFLFNSVLYEQIDGVGMGQPCAPTLAEIFLTHHEKTWLEQCPLTFKPVHYKRYVDDTFLLFSDPTHIQPFLDYINSQHPNIKFTCDIENNNSLPFLDVNVVRLGNSFATEIYRKPTFTGLGTSFFSFDPFIYKINAIKTLIHRAYHITSTFTGFHKEILFLENFFSNNGFPKSIFYKNVKSFLNKLYSNNPQPIIVPKQQIYASIPYIGYASDQLKKEIVKITTKLYPQIELKLVSTNNFSISSLFKHKEKLPKSMCSNIIYSFTCSTCNSRYFGSTTRQFKTRIYEHLGKSARTNIPLTSPPFSAIRQHCSDNNHPLNTDDFKIVDKCRNNIRTLESLYIFKHKPKLNSGLPMDLELVS